MVCNNKLVLEINQGCPRGFGFTLNQRVCNLETGEYDIKPLDLTGLTIVFQVKAAPYYALKALIDKEITENESVDGYINNPQEGKFIVNITQEDSIKLPPKEYALMILLKDGDTTTHLSGDGNCYAIYRVCYQ